MAGYGFHPDALIEYSDATEYYLEQAPPIVAAGFVAEVESAITTILEAPTRWRIVDKPGIRRYLVHRYPYAIYYQWQAERDRVTIYAVMHLSRRPGYWRERWPS
ncbi:MAG: type II toxin-antitoxin system RelE/ParE family toxin [Verrucomicrobia subdivision 3 bacterium]|nr:type II toxin-antitoxin system RelE/ParE family toxin [Limisphaerales bacterium]